MRKIRRFFIRLIFVVPILILLYVSNKTFEHKDLNTAFLSDHVVKSTDKVRYDDVGSNSIFTRDNGANNENLLKFGENKNIKSDDAQLKADEEMHNSESGLDNFIQRSDQHDKKDYQRKPLKLPPFVSYSPDNGPGEHGKAVRDVLNSKDKKESERLFALNFFNQFISDKISVHRRLDDARIQGCKDLSYPESLPMASVILCFRNEAWSVLLRSVHSIIDRSPPELIREIILVDDFSTMDHLKGPLDQYMGEIPKVKIIRTSKREGLIRARLMGYDAADGPILVFLDSHIECFPGWLEPLLARIAEEPKSVVFPKIPSIDSHTFSTSNMASEMVGSFNWVGLTFIWAGMTPTEKKRREKKTDPIRSPTMPGGLFAIDKQWFTTLGTYDQQLDFWGGENMELSFKTWMCNGTIETIPCSQVGHVYRENNPNHWSVGNVVARNSIRVAEVWMDEYKEVFYDFSYSKPNFVDVSERKKLRESLHCHNFKWYLDNVLEFKPPTVIASGEIRSMSRSQCLDSMGAKHSPELYFCHGTGHNQRWIVTQDNFIMQGLQNYLCYEEKQLRLNGCTDPNKTWLLNYKEGRLQHSESGLCLEIRKQKKLAMVKCNGSKRQRWILPTRKTT